MKSSQSLASMSVTMALLSASEAVLNRSFEVLLEGPEDVVEAAEPPVITAKVGKSSMLTDELESEKSDPPEAKWTASLVAFMPSALSMHLVIIDGGL